MDQVPLSDKDRASKKSAVDDAVAARKAAIVYFNRAKEMLGSRRSNNAAATHNLEHAVFLELQRAYMIFDKDPFIGINHAIWLGRMGNIEEAVRLLLAQSTKVTPVFGVIVMRMQDICWQSRGSGMLHCEYWTWR